MLRIILLPKLLALLAVLAPLAAAGDTSLEWYADGYNKALREAKANDAPLLIAFAPDWSDYSNKLIAETFANGDVAQALSETICLKYTTEGGNMTSLVNRYNIEQFPAIVVAMPNGDINELITGFIPPEPLLEQLYRIHSADNTVASHRDAVEANPDDLGMQYALAQKLASCWDWRNHGRTIKAIRRADPKGETLGGAKVVVDELMDTIEWPADDSDERVDLSGVLAAVGKSTSDAVRFEGFNRIANTQAQMGQLGDSRRSFMSAWQTAPKDQAANWAHDVANFIVHYDEGDLTTDEKAFAVKLAYAAARGAEKTCAGEIAKCETGGDMVCEAGESCEGCESCEAGDMSGDMAKGGDMADGGDGDGYGSPEDRVADLNRWLATRLNLLSQVQYLYGEGTEGDRARLAVGTMQRCCELDPQNEDYISILDTYRMSM